MPPKPEFDTSLIDVCYKLAEQWKDKVSLTVYQSSNFRALLECVLTRIKNFTPSPKDVESLSGNQKLVFLQQLLTFPEPLDAERVEKMGDVYEFNSSKNAEVKSGYFEVSLKSKVTSTYQHVAELLGQVGRMKFVRPLFTALNKVDRPLALSTFEKNKGFYHPICRAMVAKDLGVSG